MNGKFFAAIFLVLLMVAVFAPYTYALNGSTAAHYDTVGFQWGRGTIAGAFATKGLNTSADSAAVFSSDSGASAGDSSTHFIPVMSDAGVVFGGSLDSIMVILPRGFRIGKPDTFNTGIDSVSTYASVNFPKTLLRAVSKQNGSALGIRDTFCLRLDTTMGAVGNERPTGAFRARLKLKGIYNDTTLFKQGMTADTNSAIVKIGNFRGYLDTIFVRGINLERSTGAVTNNFLMDTVFVLISAGNKNKLMFFRGTETLASSDTAGTAIANASAANLWGQNGTFYVGVCDVWGNLVESDSTTSVTLQVWGSSGQNPPSGLGRIRQVPYQGTFTLATQLTSTNSTGYLGRYFARIPDVGFTRTGSGIYLKASSTSLTDGTTSSITINPAPPQTVSFVSTETVPHSSPDTMAVGATKQFKVTVTDSFSNAMANDTVSVRNVLGGTMFSVSPHFFASGSPSVFTTEVTADANPDSGKLSAAGEFVFSYTTTGAVGTDTLVVRPFNNLRGGSIASLETRYLIRVTAGAVNQVTITPITSNLNVHSSNTRSSTRYTNKAAIHPDTSSFQGAVIAGDTVSIRVVFKDANGNIKNFSTSDFAQITWNTTGRKATAPSQSTAVLDSVTISGTQYYVGKFLYPTKKNPLDRDTLNATYNGVYTSSSTIFQTVGGPPASAVLMAPDSLTGTNSVAADTMQVADSLLVQALVYDKNGNFADTVKSILWSILDRPTGGKDGFNRLYANQATYPDPTDSTTTIGVRAGTVDTIYHFTKWRQAGSGTVGSGGYAFDSTMIQNAFFSDSAAGLSKILARYNATGGLTLDTILIYKQPRPISKLTLTTGRTTTFATTTIDTTISSGQTAYYFATMKDLYGNVVAPDTSRSQANGGTSTKNWPKTQRVYRSSSAYNQAGASAPYTTDAIFGSSVLSGKPTTRDSLRFVSRMNVLKGSDSLITFGTDTTVVQSGTAHIRFSMTSLGTVQGFDWVIAYYTKGNNSQTSTATTTGAFDSVRIKTSLPLNLYTFKISISTTSSSPGTNDSTGVKTGVAGRPVYVRLTPRDSTGADIYTFQYRYLKLEVISLTTASVTDTLKEAFQKIGRKLEGVYWAASTTNDESLTDSTDGTAYGAKGGGATGTDSTFTDNYEDFMFIPSKVDSYAVRVTSRRYPTTDLRYAVRRSDSSAYAGKATIKINHSTIDTVVLASSMRTGLGYAQSTPFDLNIALKDSFLNAVNDTSYVVSLTSNENDIKGIDNRIVVKDNKSIRIEPNSTMSNLAFYAEVSSDIFGNNVSPTRRGNVGGVTVSPATINAPAVLRGRDFPNDRGGWVELVWPPSSNHPNNPNSTIDDNMPIDYYAVYRSLTSSVANAVQWEIVPAIPLPSGLDSVRAAISMHGDTSSFAYYWVAAVKGALPPGVVASSSIPKEAGIQLPENMVMGIPVPKEMQMSAAGVSGVQAVVGAQGAIISAVTNNVKVRSLDNTLPVGVFRPGATSIQLEDVLVVAAVFGDTKNYDPIYDIVKDGVVDIEDILYQILRLGSVGKEGKDGALINDGVNLGAALALNTASENSGSIFNIGVTIDKVKEVAGYRFTVVYDPKNYEFVEAIEGAFLGSKQGKPLFVKNDEVKGEVTVVGLLAGTDMEKAPDGNGILANMKFDWISDVMSEITVERIQLIDRNGLVNELKPVKLERPIALPTEYALDQNYPNPFNPETTIKFSLPEAAKVTLTIYNILGQKVKTLVNEDMKAGFKSMIWNGNNDLGVKVASGVYIYQVKAGKFVAQKKMVFMK